ncbi:MAG TPA: hypothetical protein VHT73_09490 [Thermodesulfobacteriota bacterium]|nr:hypothetical protein [Thermodesulfobacteriota bacterium]
MERKLLGELLIGAGSINMNQLNHALETQQITKEKLGQILMKQGYITEDTLTHFLGQQQGIPGMSLNRLRNTVNEDTCFMIPKHTAEECKAIPISFKSEGGVKKLVVAMAEPSNLKVINTLASITGCSIEPVFALEENLEQIIHQFNAWK